MLWKSCGRKKKEEKKQYSQYPDQDSNRGLHKMQRRNGAVAANIIGAIWLRNQYDEERLQLIAS
jgi:hypothetical protein